MCCEWLGERGYILTKGVVMKIIQIAPVVESRDRGNVNTTVYGLGDDGKVYYWGIIKSVKVTNNEPDEEGLGYHYEHEYGWLEYRP
jgi:hypothetical protein